MANHSVDWGITVRFECSFSYCAALHGGFATHYYQPSVCFRFGSQGRAYPGAFQVVVAWVSWEDLMLSYQEIWMASKDLIINKMQKSKKPKRCKSIISA